VWHGAIFNINVMVKCISKNPISVVNYTCNRQMQKQRIIAVEIQLPSFFVMPTIRKWRYRKVSKMSKLIIEKYTLSRPCTTWTEHKHSHGQESMHKENTGTEKSNHLPSSAAAATELLYTHKYYVMPTISQDTCPIEPCYTIEYCFYTESGPFIFKHLWHHYVAQT